MKLRLPFSLEIFCLSLALVLNVYISTSSKFIWLPQRSKHCEWLLVSLCLLLLSAWSSINMDRLSCKVSASLLMSMNLSYSIPWKGALNSGRRLSIHDLCPANAVGTLGSSRVKISNLNFYRARVGEAHQSNLRITWTVHKSQNHAGVRTSSRTDDPRRMYCTSSSGSQCLWPSIFDDNCYFVHVDGSEESKTSAFTRRRPPDLSEVGSLITGICEASSVEKIEMKLNGFQLYLVRNPTRKTATLPPSPQSLAPVKADAAPEEPVASASLPEPSLAVTKSIFSVHRWQITLTKAANEGLVVLQSPKVGFFKRSRTIKGKHALPACKERQIVEGGQVVCYIDQLGGEMPIKADVSGEVIKILLEDGDPVGYEDALMTILPSSPEIKMLQ